MLLASPAFASTKESAVRIDSLSSFPFLSFLEEPQRQTWVLTGPNAATTVISFDPMLRSSDFTILLRAAAAGLGIALLPAEVAEDEIRTGRLMIDYLAERQGPQKQETRDDPFGKSKKQAGQGHIVAATPIRCLPRHTTIRHRPRSPMPYRRAWSLPDPITTGPGRIGAAGTATGRTSPMVMGIGAARIIAGDGRRRASVAFSMVGLDGPNRS